MRRPWLPPLVAASALLVSAAPALACGGLIGPNGAVNLLRTTTLAAYHDGVEHYVTSFEFAGGGGTVRLADPAAGRPDQGRARRRLDPAAPRARDRSTTAGSGLRPPRGGRRGRRGRGPPRDHDRRARHHRPSRAAPTRSACGRASTASACRPMRRRCSTSTPSAAQIFLAAVFDGDAAVGAGPGRRRRHAGAPDDPDRQPVGAAAHPGPGQARPRTPCEADVFLLTDAMPAMLPDAGAFAANDGLVLDHSARASDALLADLRSDDGMEWVPDDAWLTKIAVDLPASALRLRSRHRRVRCRPALSRWTPATPPSARIPPHGRRSHSSSAWPRSPSWRCPVGRAASRRHREASRSGDAARRMTRRWLLAAAALLLVASSVAGCGPASTTVTIRIHHSAFDVVRGDRAARRADHLHPGQRRPDRPRVAHR